MAKEFYTNGTGLSQTLNPSDESKIRIYDSKADADLDLANIAENEIIATKAGESEGVIEVVDTVEEDNPNPVSSGGVYDYVKAFDRNNFHISSSTVDSTTFKFRCPYSYFSNDFDNSTFVITATRSSAGYNKTATLLLTIKNTENDLRNSIYTITESSYTGTASCTINGDYVEVTITFNYSLKGVTVDSISGVPVEYMV